MSVRTARRLLFALLFLTAPLPMAGPFEALAPPVRYAILTAAAGAVAAVEGAAGPVPRILAFFGVHALAGVALAWLAGWGAARLLAPLPPRARGALVVAAWAALAFWALAFEPYHTPFGRAPSGGLRDVLS